MPFIVGDEGETWGMVSIGYGMLAGALLIYQKSKANQVYPILEKLTFSLAFNLGYLGEYCYNNTFLLNGDWNVDEHQREDLFFHVYPTTLGQETWQIEFYGDQRGYGQKAKGQDQMRFYRPNSLGNYDYIWLVRAE